MAGCKTYPEIGSEFNGKHGKYKLKKKIGEGGNGTVYLADIFEADEELDKEKEYVIKVLTLGLNNEKEIDKRRARFKKEIDKVVELQNCVEGIIPIFDSSILCGIEQEYLWYLMPKAELYIPKKYNVEQRIMYMYQVGECLSQLHKLGYAHRDIKPSNLLIYNNRLCLSDFGLIWNCNDNDDNLTDENDCLGPQGIRPSELQHVEKMKDVDYRKSDVYLFAKTIWLVLKSSKKCFLKEYSRVDDCIYIDKNEIGVDSLEPLHRLMIKATKNDYWERCDIEDCLLYLEEQISIIKGTVQKEQLRSWKYYECINRNCDIIQADEKIYRKVPSIIKILEELSEIVELVFTSEGEEIVALPLMRVKYNQNNLFELELVNPYTNGRKKIIELAISEIILKENKTYEFNTVQFDSNYSDIIMVERITKALKCPDKRVQLNATYLIKMRIYKNVSR